MALDLANSDLSGNLFDSINKMLENGVNPVDMEKQIWQRYGKTQAVLILDSVGFTRITRDRGTVYFLTQVLQMRSLLLPVFEDFNCTATTTENDSIFAYFNCPKQALEAALSANKILKGRQLMLTDDEPFRICIGIGYGELLYSESLEGYYGDEMNLASKLGEDTAAGDEILLTSAAYAGISDERKTLFHSQQTKVSGNDLQYYKTTVTPDL